jgi:hypothetical protein
LALVRKKKAMNDQIEQFTVDAPNRSSNGRVAVLQK